MQAAVVQLSRVLWEKRWRVRAYGEMFALCLRIVDDGGAFYVELEAGAHRARIPLVELSMPLLMVEGFIELNLTIRDLAMPGGQLHKVCLEVKADVQALDSAVLVCQFLTFGALGHRLVPDVVEVREI